MVKVISIGGWIRIFVLAHLGAALVRTIEMTFTM